MQEHSPKLPTGLPIQFDRPVLVVGGGPFDPKLAEKLVGRGFALIAADGAADDLMLGGLTPELIIGDFDSISDANAFKGISRLVHLTEQDTTDFEKCLHATEAPLYVGLGLTGRRFDHTLAAVHVAARYGASKRLVLVGEDEAMAVARGKFAIEVSAGTRVSIYPLSPIRFAGSKGLVFRLDGLTLAQGERIGTSNQASGGRVEIVPAAGDAMPYLVILPLEIFESVLEAMSR
ncbi:MAG: thiamine diphosphokinase [Cucumibacter sp.]